MASGRESHGLSNNFCPTLSFHNLSLKRTMENKYKWTDYLCEGCRQYKMVKKRESDGKMLCKKCSKNTSLTMAINSAKSR